MHHYEGDGRRERGRIARTEKLDKIYRLTHLYQLSYEHYIQKKLLVDLPVNRQNS